MTPFNSFSVSLNYVFVFHSQRKTPLSSIDLKIKVNDVIALPKIVSIRIDKLSQA